MQKIRAVGSNYILKQINEDNTCRCKESGVLVLRASPPPRYKVIDCDYPEHINKLVCFKNYPTHIEVNEETFLIVAKEDIIAVIDEE